jgi:hypothetical protein
MNKLISNATITAAQNNNQGLTTFTLKTPDNKEYEIRDCGELLNLLYVDGPRVYWGTYMYTGDDGLSHCIKAFVLRYQDVVNSVDIADLLLVFDI